MKKRIYMIDPSHETETHGLGSDIMPYQLGLIAAFALKRLSGEVEVEIFKFLPDFERAYRRRKPWLVAISNYFWNARLGRTVLTMIKDRDPDIITVAGGPDYPDEDDRQDRWLRDRDDVDFYIYKDGETPFAELVAHLLRHGDVNAAKAARLDSVHGLIAGVAHKGKTAPRLRDLSVIPSPHTEGLLDKFYDGRLMPMIQTNRGCPFSCTFCVEGMSYYQKVYKSSFERTKAEIDYIAAHVSPRTQLLRISDSNFGMYPEDIKLCEYIGQIQENTGFPKFVYCSAGKNKQDRILKCNELLHGAMRLTASVQSFDETVLHNVKRSNISVDSLMALADEVADTLTYSYSETMLGIPGDSLAATERTFEQLTTAGIGTIIQQQTVLLDGTEMASKESLAEFGIESKFRPPQRSFGVYDFFGESVPSMEVEEIIVANNTLSFDDYLKCRRLYFAIIVFYNDRIFGEVHGLLRLLGLPTFGWIKLLNDNHNNFAPAIGDIFDQFVAATEAELWPTPEALIDDFKARPERYISGDAGFNLSYTYKRKAIIDQFEALHREAFIYLARYLEAQGIECDDALDAVRRYSYHSKINLLDPDRQTTETYAYDIPRMIGDVKYVRDGGDLEGLHYPVTLRLSHTDEQKAVIERLYDFYGDHDGGITYLLARYPLKRLYRAVDVISGGVDAARPDPVAAVQSDEFVSAIT